MARGGGEKERYHVRQTRALTVLRALYPEGYLPLLGSMRSKLSQVWDVGLVPLEDRLPVFAKVLPHRDGHPAGEVLEGMAEARAWVGLWFPAQLRAGTPAAHLWCFGHIPSKTYGGIRHGPYDFDSPTDLSLLVGWQFHWSRGKRRGVWGKGLSHYWAGEKCKRLKIPAAWSAEPQKYTRRDRRERISRRRVKRGKPPLPKENPPEFYLRGVLLFLASVNSRQRSFPLLDLFGSVD